MRLIFFLLLLSACAVKKQKSVVRETVEIQSRKEISSEASGLKTEKLAAVSFTWKEAETEYQAEIVPEGEFTFTPGGSFQGKASSLRISGRSTASEASNDSLISETAEQSTSAYSETSEEMRKEEKEEKHLDKKSSPSFSFLLLPAILLAVVFFMLFKRGILRFPF